MRSRRKDHRGGLDMSQQTGHLALHHVVEAILTLIWLALWGCTSSTPEAPSTPREATPPTLVAHTAIALARTTEGLTLDLPASTRPDGADAPETFRPFGDVKVKERKDDFVVYRVPLPVHSDLFPDKQAGARSFGNFSPPGLEIRVRGEQVRFLRYARGANTYGYDRRHLLLGLPPDVPKPDASDITLSWPKATARERSLHLGTSDMSAEDFSLRTLTIGVDATTGVLLPAPGSATWTLQVPADGVLSTRATILPPAIVGASASSGALAAVEVVTPEGTTEVGTTALEVDSWTDWRVDLSAWAGQTVDLRMSTQGGSDTHFDLVFFEEPTVYTPKTDPKRVVLVFMDTVRRDHLGFYGYARNTTPKLDRWAADALRFDQHHTVAPWTLPSARAAMTGHQPESYFDVPTLPAELAAAGFYTSGIVANAYLSQTFDMHRGFAHYRYKHLLAADELVDHAIDVMDRHADRDTLVWVQFMEAHLPFMEPPAYRELFAGDQPEALRAVTRNELVKLKPSSPAFDEINTYVQARYDQNIRVLDDQIDRLLSAAGPDATVVLFADHGEEFWDHGNYEHGHSFYEELLSVPMVIRDPHLPPGAFDVPTSLLDLAPTVLELAGIDPGERPGRSAVAAAFGDADAQAAFEARPHGFGRPLSGREGWGTIHEGAKWIHRDGKDKRYDLVQDPGETKALPAADTTEDMAELAEALGRDVVRTWRVRLTPQKARQPVTLRITHPDGFAATWKGYDPRANHEGVEPVLDGDTVTVVQQPGQRLPATLFLQPKGAHTDTAGLAVQLTGDKLDASAAASADGPHILGPLHSRWRLTIDEVVSPVPGGKEVSAFHPDMKAQLEELGYLDDAE